jgi:hypothetical protein
MPHTSGCNWGRIGYLLARERVTCLDAEVDRLGMCKRMGYLLARECVTCLDTEVDRLGSLSKNCRSLDRGIMGSSRGLRTAAPPFKRGCWFLTKSTYITSSLVSETSTGTRHSLDDRGLIPLPVRGSTR